MSKLLKDVLPHEFFGGEYEDAAAMALVNEEIAVTHDGCEAGHSWPGKHKNVYTWWELKNGKRVGLNENPAIGWSFPVLGKKRKKDAVS